MVELKDIKRYYEELDGLLDCGDSSCPFKKKNEHGVYGMRTNGGCRCFKYIDPPKKGRAIDRLVRIVKKAIDEGLL